MNVNRKTLVNIAGLAGGIGLVAYRFFGDFIKYAPERFLSGSQANLHAQLNCELAIGLPMLARSLVAVTSPKLRHLVLGGPVS